MIIEKLKLKRKIKKFNYLFIEKDNSFLDNSSIDDLNKLLEFIKSSNTILRNFYKESRNRYIINFQSYENLYKNYNKEVFLETLKIKIRNENDSRRKLFYDLLDGKITIDDSTYHDLCNVSKEFANSFFNAIKKPTLTTNNNSSSWFSILQNDYILDILTYFEHHSYFKYNHTYDIRKLEEELLGVTTSNYIVESWSSSIAYLCELEDLEEKTIFGSNVEIRKDIYDKIKKYLFNEKDKYFMTLDEVKQDSRLL